MFKKKKDEKVKTNTKLSKKEPNSDKKETRRKRKKAASMLDVIPIVNIDEMQQCFITADKKYIDIIEIIGKDLSSAGDDVTTHDALILERMFKTYKDDLKFLFMNFPIDTNRQKKYFIGRLNKTNNPVFRQGLEEKIRELEYLELHRSNKEFYVMTFSSSLEENIKNTNAIKNSLGYLAKEMDLSKKINVMYKIANKNIQVV